MAIQSISTENIRKTTTERAPLQAVSQTKPDEPSAFQRVLEGLGKEINTGERTMHRVQAAGRGGQEVAPADLLALQAGVYRYGEVVDLASKIIDRASSGLKTVIGGGGQ